MMLLKISAVAALFCSGMAMKGNPDEGDYQAGDIVQFTDKGVGKLCKITKMDGMKIHGKGVEIEKGFNVEILRKVCSNSRNWEEAQALLIRAFSLTAEQCLQTMGDWYHACYRPSENEVWELILNRNWVREEVIEQLTVPDMYSHSLRDTARETASKKEHWANRVKRVQRKLKKLRKSTSSNFSICGYLKTEKKSFTEHDCRPNHYNATRSFLYHCDRLKDALEILKNSSSDTDNKIAKEVQSWVNHVDYYAIPTSYGDLGRVNCYRHKDLKQYDEMLEKVYRGYPREDFPKLRKLE